MDRYLFNSISSTPPHMCNIAVKERRLGYLGPESSLVRVQFTTISRNHPPVI
jgi:hypothetical protein